ncbi:MAG: polyprenyl synthetase family protein [Phycisphaerales bacterium]|nr:MAG: polyprenyl synthetase family protein [Phycisphaerales bacterium]
MQFPAHIDMPAGASSPELAAFKLVSDDMHRVRSLINEQLIASAPAFAGLDSPEPRHRPADAARLLEYISARSGKMLRPGLVLLAGRCFGKVTDQHIKVAAILEMMHNATLLHDDVMDEGQKRRGLPTVNSVCGNEVAVLLGDFLLSRVFNMCTELEPQAAKVVAGSAVRLCEGELGQVVRKHNWQLTEPEYIEIITEKSAVLFNSACYLGALLAKTDERHARSLAEFGLNCGIAFQITDDLLDLIGDESRTGKTLGTDVGKQKLTLAMIHLLGAADASEKKSIIDSFLDREDAQYDRHALVKLLNRYGSLEYVRKRAREFIATAVRALSDLKRCDAKEALIETAEFMMSRTT